MAYTYLIGWRNLNKFYYGVRFSKNCRPEDLWTSYFTSSKHVKNFANQYGDPDVIEIRKEFNDVNKARLWEEKVLRKMKVLEKDNWINKNIAGAIDIQYCIMGGKYHKGLKKPKQSIKMSGKNNPMFGKKRPENSARNKVMAQNNVGKSWFNNGIENKRYFECDVPENWNKGMIMKRRTI